MKSTRITPQQIAQRLVEGALHPPASATLADLAEARRPIEWAWPGWLPAGFLTILASQAGIGKSSLCLHLAATCWDGRAWPDGTPFTATPGKILWVESEGSHYLNLERAQRWGLDPSQIVIPDGDPHQNFKLVGFKNEGDQKQAVKNLMGPAMSNRVRLIVLDSLSGLIAGPGSPRRIRALLEALAGLASRLRIPVLLTHHLRKRTSFDGKDGNINLDRLLGSSVISQVPRLIWGLDVPDPADPDNRRLSVIKNNLAPFPEPLGFRMDDQGLHFGPPPKPPAHTSQIDQAINFLAELLASGPLPATQVKAAASAAGLAPTTLKRAKKRLGVKSRKRVEAWMWELL